MRTSNKILLGLLILVFTVPFMLAASLSSKIKKGEFRVVENEKMKKGDLVKGQFLAGKVVKVIAPAPEFLEVKLRAGTQTNFSYYKRYDVDSFTVTNTGDTIVMQYVGKTKDAFNDERTWGERMMIQAELPLVNSVIVDGAIVILDSFPTPDNNLSVVIKNGGELKARSKKGEPVSKANFETPAKAKEATIAKAEVGSKLSLVDKIMKLKSAGAAQVELNIKEQLLEVLIKGI